MSSKVAIVRCDHYNRDDVRTAVGRAIDLLGGVGSFVNPGETVLVKPNLLSPRPPEKGVTTHPAVVQAVIDLWMSAGARVIFGDSPPLLAEKESGYKRLLDATGMSGVEKRTGAMAVRFEDASVTIESPTGRYYRGFEIGKHVADADSIVSIPKLKTHGLTLLTGAVKNIFGCIPGKRKALFHAQAGESSQIFSQMLVDLLGAVRPRLSIMDAISAMDGDGPVDGRVRHLGVILASADPVALDAVASVILGIDPMRVDTTRLSSEQGIGVGDIASIEVVGEQIEDVARNGLLMPQSKSLWTRIPRPVRIILKNQLVPYPVITASCKNCGACVDVCPMKTIKPGKRRPSIELPDCIRCYCCREVCEHASVNLRLGRMAAGIRLLRDTRNSVLRLMGRR